MPKYFLRPVTLGVIFAVVTVVGFHALEAQSPDVITMRFDVYRNGTKISSPMVKTLDRNAATVSQDGISISVTPRRIASDKVFADVEFRTPGDSVRLQSTMLVSGEEPGRLSTSSAGEDSFEVHVSLLPIL